MKLRMLDSSIRLRLDRRELRQLLENGLLECRTRFGTWSELVYALRIVRQDVPLRADLAFNRINVYVDQHTATEWAHSDGASITCTQRAGDVELRLLLEKDFPCQHSGAEDPTEKFTPTTMAVDSNAVGR